MDGLGAAAAATEGSAALVGAGASADADAGTSEAPTSPGGCPCSAAEALESGAVAPADLASHPDSSRPASPAPTCDSGCQDLPRDEAQRTPPEGGGLEQKTRKIKQIVEEAISSESRQVVLKILDEVNQLSMVEKLYLYLKLPTGKAAPVDPLRHLLMVSGL